MRYSLFSRVSFCLLMVSLAVGAFGQRPMRKPRARHRPDPRVHSVLLPMFLVVKRAGFQVRTLPPTHYVFMASEIGVLYKGFAGKVKAPQEVVMLTYGYKGGGVVRLYETKAVPGISPEVLTRAIAAAGYFHDVNGRPGWVVQGTTLGGVDVVPTSGQGSIVPGALASLKSGG